MPRMRDDDGMLMNHYEFVVMDERYDQKIEDWQELSLHMTSPRNFLSNTLHSYVDAHKTTSPGAKEVCPVMVRLQYSDGKLIQRCILTSDATRRISRGL